MDVARLIQKEGFRKNRSPQTIKTYTHVVEKFLHTYNKDPKEVTKKDIEFHLEKLLHQNSSGNTVNVHLNALKFFYEKVLHKRLTVNIQYCKTRKTLPSYLTQQEIQSFFNAISVRKHKLIVKFMYSAGLRVSEAVTMKVKNFDFENNYGWVRQGKGRKDRMFVVAKGLKYDLQQWIKDNNLQKEDWLFSGLHEKHYSAESVRQIIKKACKRTRIAKRVTPHTLRHSFATHLIENGYAVTEVQPLLGHNSLETTMIYLHMAAPTLLKVQSPLDALEKKSRKILGKHLPQP